MTEAIPANANEHCPGPSSEQAGKSSSCEGCPNQNVCKSGAAQAVDPDLEKIKARLRGVKHKLLVLSGKGGVGKSTLSAQIAFGLAESGKEVGLLDIDICGPSVPKMFGVEGEEVHQSNMGWSPVYVEDNLGVMSIGFMLPDPNEAVVWRGPRKNALIKQFVKDVDWGELDYLVVDAPPGTSDEHISVVQYLQPDAQFDGAVIVSTPQEVSLIDVRKEINFCRKVGLPVLGVVENMSELRLKLSSFRFYDYSSAVGSKGEPEDCTEKTLALIREKVPDLEQLVLSTQVLSNASGGAEAMAKQMQVPFLGRIPLDPSLGRAAEEGKSFAEYKPSHPSSQVALRSVIEATAKALGEEL